MGPCGCQVWGIGNQVWEHFGDHPTAERQCGGRPKCSGTGQSGGWMGHCGDPVWGTGNQVRVHFSRPYWPGTPI